MLARVFRSLIAFGVVFVAYQAYALMVAPALEPTIAVRKSAPSTAGDRDRARNAVGRYQKLLSHYFPADHWALTGLPKVLESGSVMLVIDNYQRDDRGRVDLTKCAAVLFPTPRVSGQAPPDDAVILEAPGGARLQFDENFQPSRGKIGRITHGEFPGPITIRSGMREPGPQDDLLITTRDVRMNESMVFTPHEVTVRHGRSTAGGRRMEIRLLEEEHARGGLKIAGVESLEIFERVKLSLRLGKINPLRDGGIAHAVQPQVIPPHGVQSHGVQSHGVALTAYTAAKPAGDNGDDNDGAAAAWTGGPELGSVYTREATAPPAAPRSPAATPNPQADASNEPPLEITCAGSFRMDFTDFVATFRDRVRVWQLNLNGQSDQMTCRELRLTFGDGADNGAGDVRIDPRREPELARRQKSTLSRLKPKRLEAVGSPVKIDSPARNLTARGRSLTFDFPRRRLSLNGSAARITRGTTLVEAPVLRYEHPPEGSPDAIGRLWMAGPGRLRAAPRGDAERPSPGDRVVETRWQKTPGVEFPVTLLRNDVDQPVLTIVGGPTIAADGLGNLAAQQLSVLLRETAPDGKQGPAIELGGSGPQQKALLPERIDATGRVTVDSPKLQAETETLTVWVQGQLSAKRPPASKPNGQSFVSRQPLVSRQTPVSRQTKPAAGGDRFRLTAKRAELEVALFAKRAEPTSLLCSGDVDFRELRPAAPLPGDEPLRVRGARLRVDGLESDALRLAILGARQPTAEDPTDGRPTDGQPTVGQRPASGGAGRAILQARGVTLHALDAHLDQATNRIWADGPGDATLRTTRDLLGQKTNAATDLHLTWKGGWEFDGRRITIREDVFGQGPHDWVRTNRLVATLARPVSLERGADTGELEVAQIDCGGGVTVDHRTIDQRGQRSQERGQMQTFSVNLLSGALAGTGPGWIRSVRLSSGGSPLAAAGGQPAAPAKPTAPERLRLLRVHFQKGLAGNYKDRARQINFLGRVQAIYGPVVAWRQDLPVVPHDRLPPDTATLACEQLQVSEDPTARLSIRPASAAGDGKLAPLELIASGSVRLEGAADDGSVFNAQATRASFNQTKELFVLEGDSRARATLWVQKPGEGTLRYPAGRISYWMKTGRVQTDGFGAINYTPTATRPPAAPAR